MALLTFRMTGQANSAFTSLFTDIVGQIIPFPESCFEQEGDNIFPPHRALIYIF
jgi:hypothetical protein